MRFTEWASREFGVPVSELSKIRFEVNGQTMSLRQALTACWDHIHRELREEIYEEGKEEGDAIGYDRGRAEGFEDGRIEAINEFERQ